MDCLWGFIDGTIRRTTRPLYHQRSIYTHFKKCHGIKFQSITVLEGFIACLQGPWPSKTHDAHMLCDSGLIEKLEANMPTNGNGVVYVMYGDLPYVQSIYLLGGSRKPPTGSNEALFNTQMSSVRITVELGFRDVVEKWKFLHFCCVMKIFEMPIAEFYTNAKLSLQYLKFSLRYAMGNMFGMFLSSYWELLPENVRWLISLSLIWLASMTGHSDT